jgi:hypothetical protein
MTHPQMTPRRRRRRRSSVVRVLTYPAGKVVKVERRSQLSLP